MLPAGTRIGQWVLESLLGEGGMSRVYKAHHADDTLLVRAVKILNTTSANLRDRMIKEGELQARLDHPNIVAVYDLLRPDDGSHPPTLILEYVNGPDLETLVEDRALSLTEIDQIAAGVFHAVGCAHEQGFVHRDLKPANILFAVVDDDLLVPKLADFGLVKDLDGKSSTQLGIALGTPRYMSPEQIQDSGSVDARSDVFSLGAVLSFMLTRKNPFGHGVDDVVEVFSAIMDVEIDAHLADIESHRPDVPPRMLDAIRGALTDVAETAYYVANEAVANVLKHSAARVASIRVTSVGTAASSHQQRDVGANRPRTDSHTSTPSSAIAGSDS